MSQPANDEFSQHLSDDEASNHEDASDTGAAPKQQQQMIPQTTAISNIKLPILMKEEFQAVERKGRKDKNILLMAIPKEHMRRFHGMDDAKEIWEAIRTRFQQLLSQLEAHSAEVSTEDANHKFLRSLPPAWSNLAMQMRTNPEIDPPLYILMIVINNLRVFEQEIQGASKTSSSAQNVAFVSQSKSSTNKVKSGFTDLEQIDDVDIEEIDINWQIAMIAIRMKKFYKKTGRRVRVDGKTPQRGHMMERRRETHFINIKKLRSKRRNQMGLLTMDDGIVNWGEHIEAEETNHALMAISSSNEENRMKAVKEKGTIAGTLEFMEDSSKDLWRLIDSGMSSNSEVGLGFEIPIKQLSEGSCGNTSEHSFETESESLSVPNEMSKSRLEVTNEKVVSELQEVEPSCAKHVKTPRQPLKDKETQKVNRKNWNDMMERELGEDCDYYEKKMAREAEVKRVVNTGNWMEKPVWTKANRVNHSNKFVPRSVQLNAGRPNFNSVRPNINTGRTNINSVRPKVNAVSSNVNTVRSRQPTPVPKTTAQMSHSNAVMGSWGSAVKTSASYNWRNSRPNFHYNSGPTFIRTVNAKGPQGRPKPAKAWIEGIFDSWHASGHLAGNKGLNWSDFEEFNGAIYYLWRHSMDEREECQGFAEIVDFLRGSNL
ncbi:hypothetical protein Tco_1064649, partial [Tanacetum coccineum]